MADSPARHEIERLNAISKGIVQEMNRKRAIDHFDCAVDGLIMCDSVGYEEARQLLRDKLIEMDVV